MKKRIQKSFKFPLSATLSHLLLTTLLFNSPQANAQAVSTTQALQTDVGKNLKVYVMVGMHVDFYHSWRGDTPDDAGWGYDVKVIRSSIEKLNEANKKGLKAKAYWDFSANNWTFGEFLPKHNPEMIPLFQTRDNNDEFIAGPFNNGLNSAATKKEFLKAIEWTMSNPDGYGLKQLFKNVGTSYRPQEMYHASNQNRWLKEAGIDSLILFYAACAFDTFAPFIAPLTWEERLNPITMKTTESDEAITVLPAMSTIDLVNYVSLENLMIDLRRRQLSGEIKRNVAIHLNMDADALSWEPMIKSKAIRSIVPNTGGLQEIIDVVNKYHWSDFTTPKDYLAIEKPLKTIVLRQDTADGSFDGMASWAEKASTGEAWAMIERSRILDRVLDFRLPQRNSHDAWQDKGFKDRVLALSTTHYGMATPLIHRERAARLKHYTESSLTDRTDELKSWFKNQISSSNTTLPELHFLEYPRFGEKKISNLNTSVQHQSFVIPSSLKGGPAGLPFIRRSLNESTDQIETFRSDKSHPHKKYSWSESSSSTCEASTNFALTAADLKVEFSAKNGIQKLTLGEDVFGSANFFSPFISWKEKSAMSKGLKTSKKAKQILPSPYLISSQTCSSAANLKETTLATSFVLKGPRAENKIDATYRFWVKNDLPYLFVDVSAFIPVTADETSEQTVDRRYMTHIDYRLQELALAQIKPEFVESRDIKVWKMNYEGEMSSYEFDYAKFNAKNLNLDSVNNHLTPGWIAVSNGKKGILIAFQTNKRAGFGAVPMRLRDRQGFKDIYLNPFGTYFGKQFDYSHVGGEKLGTLLANLGGVFVRPNAPSYAGHALHFELMIAPYKGDEPSKHLVQAALDFAYPAVGILNSVDKGSVELQDDFQAEQLGFQAQTHARERHLFGNTLTTPVGLGVAPMDRGARVSWSSTNPSAVDGYEVGYRKKGYFASWTFIRTKETSAVISGLKNNRLYEITVRSVRSGSSAAHSGPNSTEAKSPLALSRSVTPLETVKDGFVNEIAPTPKLIGMFIDSIFKYARTKDPDRK